MPLLRVWPITRFSSIGFMHIFKAGGSTYGVALAKYTRAHRVPFFTDMRHPAAYELASRPIWSVGSFDRHE